MIIEGIGEHLGSTLRRANVHIIFFCPFIKVAALSKVLEGVTDEVPIEIVTTWKVQNFWQGVSDVELFTFCKDRQIPLYGNNKLHMKVILVDKQHLVLTSANITGAALGYSINHNIEGLEEFNVTAKDVQKLASVKNCSTLIEDDLYHTTIQILESLEPETRPSFEEPLKDLEERPCLVQDLPATSSVEELFIEYKKGDLKEMSDAAREDLYKYEIPPDLERDLFDQYLHRKFHSLPIVKVVESDLAVEERYFGRMKELLQRLDESSPKPLLKELTSVTQNLYRWLVELDSDKYKIDRPNHSERIRKT